MKPILASLILFFFPLSLVANTWTMPRPIVPALKIVELIPPDPQTHTFPALDTNNTFTGAQTFTSYLTASQTGTYTNTQMNEYNQFLLNSCSPKNISNNGGSGFFVTDALTGCNNIPATSTVTNGSGVSGYVANASASTSGVAGLFITQAAANNTKNWGINPVCGGKFLGTVYTGVTCKNEFDIGVNTSTTTGQGIQINGNFFAQPFGSFPGLQITTSGTVGNGWTAGILIQTGAVPSGVGMQLSPIAIGNGQFSQYINYLGTDSGGTSHQANTLIDPNGNYLIRPGLAVYSFSPTGIQNGRAYSSNGTAALLSGTGACASRSSQIGGPTAGQVNCTGTTGASTLTITTGLTANNGMSCFASDVTHTLAGSQSAISAAACTMTFSNVTTNDVITFGALLY
jgi:hypothetical protein